MPPPHKHKWKPIRWMITKGGVRRPIKQLCSCGVWRYLDENGDVIDLGVPEA